MGRVYQARDLLLERFVAVKLLPAWRREHLQARKRLTDEAAFAARVQHPNVVSIHDLIACDDGSPCLVLEYVEGRSVRAVLRARGPLAPLTATRVVAQACHALRAVHEAGLVHRDVKPDNLMLSAAGRVKLVDFGVALALAQPEPTLAGAVAGSAPYMSPEQAWGEPLDQRSDLYSLGAAYHEMLTGSRPYQAATLPADHDGPPRPVDRPGGHGSRLPGLATLPGSPGGAEVPAAERRSQGGGAVWPGDPGAGEGGASPPGQGGVHLRQRRRRRR
jgi:serine/threonine-protein kinase